MRDRRQQFILLHHVRYVLMVRTWPRSAESFLPLWIRSLPRLGQSCRFVVSKCAWVSDWGCQIAMALFINNLLVGGFKHLSFSIPISVNGCHFVDVVWKQERHIHPKYPKTASHFSPSWTQKSCIGCKLPEIGGRNPPNFGGLCHWVYHMVNFTDFFLLLLLVCSNDLHGKKASTWASCLWQSASCGWRTRWTKNVNTSCDTSRTAQQGRELKTAGRQVAARWPMVALSLSFSLSNLEQAFLFGETWISWDIW